MDQRLGEGAAPREAAAYILELTADLSRIARRYRMDTLCYLLEMARLEAQNVAGGLPASAEKSINP